MLGPLALYLEMARLTMRGLTRRRRSGSRLASTLRPMVPTRSMVVAASTPAAWMSWSRAVARAMVKLARSGSVPGWMAVVVGQGGGQPVDAGGASGGGGDGDLGLDHADLDLADPRQVGPVGVAGQHRQLAVGLEPHQQMRLGGGDLAQEGGVVEVAVQQHEHARPQAAQQPTGIAWLAAAGGAVGGVDQAAGAAGHQGDQAQQRIARAAVV